MTGTVHIPLDLEIRSARTPKYYFLHFPYFQPPKVFGVHSLTTPDPSDVVPLGSPCRLISQNFHNLFNVNYNDPSRYNNQAHLENRRRWAPGGRQGLYPLSWYAHPLQAAHRLYYIFDPVFPLSVFFHFLSCTYMGFEHYLPCILRCMKKIYITVLTYLFTYYIVLQEAASCCGKRLSSINIYHVISVVGKVT